MSGLGPTGSSPPAPSAGARRFVERLASQAETTGQPLALDSVVLIDYFAGNEPVASLLDVPLLHPAVPVVVSTVALSELVTRSATVGDQARINAVIAALRAFPHLRLADFDGDHALETAFVRARTNLRLPDAAIVATAVLANAGALLGNDRQWRHRPLGVPYHHLDDILALP